MGRRKLQIWKHSDRDSGVRRSLASGVPTADGGAAGNRLAGLLQEFHHQMLLTYPGAGRYRILHPVLWVMMFCGFAYRNVKMRRVSG